MPLAAQLLDTDYMSEPEESGQLFGGYSDESKAQLRRLLRTEKSDHV